MRHWTFPPLSGLKPTKLVRFLVVPRLFHGFEKLLTLFCFLCSGSAIPEAMASSGDYVYVSSYGGRYVGKDNAVVLEFVRRRFTFPSRLALIPSIFSFL
jgi:hypothetical protein